VPTVGRLSGGLIPTSAAGLSLRDGHAAAAESGTVERAPVPRIAAARREVAEHEKSSGAETPLHDAVGGRTVEKVSPHHDLLNEGIGFVAACAASVIETQPK